MDAITALELGGMIGKTSIITTASLPRKAMLRRRVLYSVMSSSMGQQQQLASQLLWYTSCAMLGHVHSSTNVEAG